MISKMLSGAESLRAWILLVGLMMAGPNLIYTQSHAAKNDLDTENTLYMFAKGGLIVIELFPKLAPKHVERLKVLTREKFYDGLNFHRVIDGFMAQTGDPRGDGTGGSSLPDLPAEFSDAKFERGVVGMARSRRPNSANSQFFIMLGDGSWLNGKYTVFGRVVEGMGFVDQIRKGPTTSNGIVPKPDRILQLFVMSDFLKIEAQRQKEIDEKNQLKQEN